jgi:hypothetical protein
MDISTKILRSNLIYEKSTQPFNPSDKEKISILTTRIESFKHEGITNKKIIFYRKDIDTKDFIKKQSKYIKDRKLTIHHLQNELSKSNKFNPNQIQLFIKNIHSDIAVMKKYSPEQNEISKKAAKAADDFEEFADFIKACQEFKKANENYSKLLKNVQEKNEGISHDDPNYTLDYEKIINRLNQTKEKYEKCLNELNSDINAEQFIFDKNIWNDEKALEKEEQRRFDLLNSTQKETTEMKINAHKLSKKIDYLKASLFENNLEILESIDSDKVSLLAKDTDKLKPLTVNWSKVIDNSESLSISDPVSSSDKVSIESSLYDKENTFSDNKLVNSSNKLIETKAVTSQEDQPMIQSRSARNMSRIPLRTPNTGSSNFPSAPKESNN